MKNTYFTALFVFGILIPSAWGGTVEIVGHGESSIAPERGQLSLVITSLCYDSSGDAKDANSVLAHEVVTALQRYVRDDSESVTSRVGVTCRQTEYFSDANGSRRVLCDRGWRASNQITIKFGDVQRTGDIHDSALEVLGQQRPDPTKLAQTYGELDSPIFTLTKATALKLRKEAQTDAWNDAKEQLAVFQAACPVNNLRLKQAFEPDFRESRFSKVGFDGAPSTPILPDRLEAHALWKFIWEFEPTALCSR